MERGKGKGLFSGVEKKVWVEGKGKKEEREHCQLMLTKEDGMAKKRRNWKREKV